MEQINIQTARKNLFHLVEQAAAGTPFIIEQEGQALVKVVPLHPPVSAENRVGFMKGEISVPGDFDEIGCDEINALFYGEES